MASSTGQSVFFLGPEFDLNDLFCSSAGSASSASDTAPSSGPSSTSLHQADPSTRPAKRDWLASILNVDDGSIDAINPSSQQQPPPGAAPSIHDLSFSELLQESPYVGSGSNDGPGQLDASSDISQFLANPNEAEEAGHRDVAQPATYGAALRLSDVEAALGTAASSSSPGTLMGPLVDEGSINVLQGVAGGLSTYPESDGGGRMRASSARVDAFPRGVGNLSYVDELIERSHSLQLPPFPVIGKGGGKKKGPRKAAATPASTKGGAAGRPLRSHLQSSQLQHEDHVDEELMPAAGLDISDQKKISKDPVVRREVHIHSERQRRKGMMHLYTTLHSLLPEGKPKTDRCSVLTETMKYIRALRQKIEELNVQKAAMKSMPAPPPMLSLAARSTTSTIKNTDKANSEAQHDHEQPAAMVVEPSPDHTSSSLTSSSSTPAADSGRTNHCSDGSAKELSQADIFAPAAADRDVAVRFFGGDAFITLRTLKRKGIWSGVLKVLDDQNVDVLNVTLSAATADTDFHCIHAKVPANTSELRSYDLHRILKALVAAQTNRIEDAQHAV